MLVPAVADGACGTGLAAYEKRIKTQKLKMEMTQAKKDVEFYMAKVEQADQLAKMESRKLDAGGAGAVAAQRDKVPHSLVIVLRLTAAWRTLTHSTCGCCWVACRSAVCSGKRTRCLTKRWRAIAWWPQHC